MSVVCWLITKVDVILAFHISVQILQKMSSTAVGAGSGQQQSTSTSVNLQKKKQVGAENSPSSPRYHFDIFSPELPESVEAVPHRGDGRLLRRPGDLPPGHGEGQTAGAGPGDDHGGRGRGGELPEYPGHRRQY